MLKSTGGIPQAHIIIGPVFGCAVRQAEGCSNQLNLLAAFEDAVTQLETSSANKGGDAVIYISFLQRDVTVTGCSGTKPGTQVYAWGTAAKLQ